MIPTRLAGMDLSRAEEPDPHLEPRAFLEEWLRYQRHEFLRKLRDLDPVGLTVFAVPPVQLSVLGLVRHMTQMEHVWLTWGLGGGDRVMAHGDDDYAGGTAESVEADLEAYFVEVARADQAIVSMSSLESRGEGHGRPLRATLVKMIDEYALHAGQAHMIRFAALGELRR